jgi:hypothetical protein
MISEYMWPQKKVFDTPKFLVLVIIGEWESLD